VNTGKHGGLRLCAHADDGGKGMHWLEPGERCTWRVAGRDRADESREPVLRIVHDDQADDDTDGA
jgi:hypothetical protein